MMNPITAGTSTCMSSAPPPRNAAMPPHSSMALRPGTGSAAHRRRSHAFISARSPPLLDSSLKTVDERNTHHEGYACNDASDVGESRSPPPLGGIHLVIFLPTILEAQR